MRKILVTSALVYANGPMHLGHLLEQIQTDIWVRFQRLRGNDCLYLGGDDAHGTPIMLYAQKLGITPEQLIHEVHESHLRDAHDFMISFDNYYTTHSTENHELVKKIYAALKQRGNIVTRSIEQAYDETAGIFLPDRFIKGRCPNCDAPDQYGDNCEQCGSTYTPNELKEPYSTLSGKPPVYRPSQHLFFTLHEYTDFLRTWSQEHLAPAIAHKLAEWLENSLKDWDISRDEPYFGFPIPDEEHKYFYVWLDAPIGYLASFMNFSQQHPEYHFDTYFKEENEVELYHFIGKDIIYFHTLFWPALLKGAGLRTPNAVFAHGYLTVNGAKMSKSRGTFILVRDYLKHLNPTYLRYYFAAKLNSSFDDLDLNFQEFINKNNSDLVGKIVNIASRSAKFIHEGFGGKLADQLPDESLFKTAQNYFKAASTAFEAREFNQAVRIILEIADLANRYIDEQKPWVLAKTAPQDPRIQEISTEMLNLYRLLMILLKPIVPDLVAKSEEFLAIPPLVWDDYQTPLLNHTIKPFVPLLSRVDPKAVTALLAHEN